MSGGATWRLLEGGRGGGVSYSPDGVISMSAPLVITQSEMMSALDSFERALEEESRAVAE